MLKVYGSEKKEKENMKMNESRLDSFQKMCRNFFQ